MALTDDINALPLTIVGGTTRGINEDSVVVHRALQELAQLIGSTPTGRALVKAADAAAVRLAAGAVSSAEVDAAIVAAFLQRVAPATTSLTIPLGGRYVTSQNFFERPTTGDRSTVVDTSFSVQFPASGRVRIKVSCFFEMKQGTYALVAYCPADGSTSTTGQIAYAGATPMTFGTLIVMEATNTPLSTKTYEIQHGMTFRAVTDGSQYGSLIGEAGQTMLIEVVPVTDVAVGVDDGNPAGAPKVTYAGLSSGNATAAPTQPNGGNPPYARQRLRWAQQADGLWAASVVFDVPSGYDPMTLTLHDTINAPASDRILLDRSSESNVVGAYTGQGTLTVSLTRQGTA